MDTANMSQNSDQLDSSDDLIAELARLMAQDARGETPANESAPGTDSAPTAQEPAPQPFLRVPGQPVTNGHSVEPAVAANDAVTGVDDDKFDFSVNLTEPAVRSVAEREADVLRAEKPADAPVETQVRKVIAPAAPEPEPMASPTVVHAEEFPSAPQQPIYPTAPVSPVAVQTPEPDAFNLFANGENGESQTQHPFQAVEAEDTDFDPIAALIRERESSQDEPQQLETPTAHEPEPYTPEVPPATEPNFQTPKENDTFSVAPVFGLGGASRGESVAAPDPLDEIESLIGNAVRQSGMPESRAAPASMQPTTPQNINTPRVDDAAQAAEAAIMAATQASSPRSRSTAFTAQRNERTEPEMTTFGSAAKESDLDNMQEMRASEPSRPLTRYIAPVVAALLLLAVGGGLYWIFGTPSSQTAGEARLMASNTTDAKQVVEQPDLNTVATGNSVVLNEMDGGSAVPAGETLVSRDQSASVDSNAVSRVISPDTDESGLANRKVRTVTVRPDGTIINGEDILAGSEILPVARPNVPALPEGAVTPDENIQISNGFADESVVASADTPSLESLAEAEGLQVIADAPVPAPRLENRTLSAEAAAQIAASPTRVAPTTQTASNSAIDLLGNPIAAPVRNSVTQASTPTISSTSVASINGTKAPAYVQLSSQRTPEAAQQTINSLNSRFGSQLSGGTLEMQQVDLADRGIFYRVRLPVSSVENANSVCSNIKSAGGDCFVRTD